MAPSSVVILGGGLTGLSSAFHLARRFPSARITLLERQAALGGWVRSKRVTLSSEAGEAEVVIEAGPRTLRPAGKSVLELVNLLGLSSSLITVPSSAPAARNRFLHVPGVPGLQRIPTSPRLASVLIPAVLRDAFRGNNASYETEDESVDSFLSRRFGPAFARTFGSALVHGIYAADSRMLSMRAAFPGLYEVTSRGYGSVVRGAILGTLRKRHSVQHNDYDLGKVQDLMKNVSVYSFKDGMGSLVHALDANLRQRENVEIVTGDGAAALYKSSRGFEVQTSSSKTISASHLVSTLPLPLLHGILERSSGPPESHRKALPQLPNLTTNPYSSVLVVNLVFPSTPSCLLHPPGFGYLIPRPKDGYGSGSADDEGLGMLGTVFDSSALAAQDRSSNPNGAPFVKMTVMLGGPQFASTAASFRSTDFVPTLLRVLSRHLSAPGGLPDPVLVEAQVHDACIPTLGVGHLTRMEELREAVARTWGREAEVIGAGVGGVSVPDCVEAGRRVGKDW